MDAASRAVSGRKAARMSTSTVILLTGSMIFFAISWSTPTDRDYHTDLKNIAYQLSRIADALRENKQ